MCIEHLIEVREDIIEHGPDGHSFWINGTHYETRLSFESDESGTKLRLDLYDVHGDVHISSTILNIPED